MGISRLTQDLLNYSEPVILGRTEVKDGEVQISRVVIDGPALVYQAYVNLVRTMSTSEKPSAALPTYRDVCKAVEAFVDMLKSQRVEVDAILFDGDLPLSKRDVRLERMAKAVNQLEVYKALNPLLPSLVSSKSTGLENLWQIASKPGIDSRARLSPPPFLVPAVIEELTLFRSSWKVQVVPEEADVACARMARTLGAAILTNDSDLAVFDLGQDGCVIFLRTLSVTEISTLTKTAEGHVWPVLRVTASCVRPHGIAQQLELASFSRLAFERQLDSGASLFVIKERARDDSRHENHLAPYNDFSKQYDLSEPEPEPDSLASLDPRTAEFIVQACRPQRNKSPHVYLPVLYDDPSRYSSWSYGSEYRRIAYTMLYNLPRRQRPEYVIEYARKGSRISDECVSFFSELELNRTTDGLLKALKTFVKPEIQASRPVTFGTHRMPMCTWHAFALVNIVQHNQLTQRAPFSHAAIDRLFVTDPQAASALFTPTWEDMHLLANVHAVLYSLRMLKQIFNWTIDEMTSLGALREPVLREEIEDIQVYLSQMPPMKDLFLNLQELRSCREEERVSAAEMVKDAMEKAGVKAEKPAINESKRERRKRKAESKSTISEKRLAGNAFSVLSNHVDEDEDTD